jgi:cold shock CspA family protein
MGKSQATFSKKENEKKKKKRRLDKEEKRAERKENSGKGKSLEDMMAYVDENGVISSTPPDPAKKKVINAEEISIDSFRYQQAPEDIIRTGTVTFFNTEKGYGFIKDLASQDSIFVHINALAEPIKENDKVTFEVEMGKKGPTAVLVKKIK